MDRTAVKQNVLNTLGKILVDKSLIQEKDDALLSELTLDELDFDEFFTCLQTEFNIVLPSRIKTEISHLPEHTTYSQLTLQGLVDLILMQMKNRKNH